MSKGSKARRRFGRVYLYVYFAYVVRPQTFVAASPTLRRPGAVSRSPRKRLRILCGDVRARTGCTATRSKVTQRNRLIHHGPLENRARIRPNRTRWTSKTGRKRHRKKPEIRRNSAFERAVSDFLRILLKTIHPKRPVSLPRVSYTTPIWSLNGLCPFRTVLGFRHLM